MNKSFYSSFAIFLSASFLLCFQAFAQVGSVENLVYQGRIANGGVALNSGVTTFEVSIFAGAANCLLYQETFSKNMAGTSGHYSLNIGSGTRTDTLFSGAAPSHSLSDALRNIGSINSLNCNGSSGNFDTSSTPTIDRRFQLRFNNSGSGWVSLPTQAIKSAPYAMQAMQVNGYGVSNLAKISGASSEVVSPAGWARLKNAGDTGIFTFTDDNSTSCAVALTGGLRYNSGNLQLCNGTTWVSLSTGGSAINALTGDVTASGTGSVAATIATGAVTSTKILDGSVATVDIADSAVTAAKLHQMSATTGQVLKWNGTAWAPAADDNTSTPADASYATKGVVQFQTDAATSGITVAAGVARLANSGATAGSYGSATQVPAITVDAFGRITAVTATTIAVPASAVSSGTLNISQGGTGASSLTANRMVMVNGTGTALTNDVCALNQLLQYNGTQWVCVAATSLGTPNAVVNGGNSYAGTMTVGTNDNNELRLETNGTDKMTVLANGNVGIGTSTPGTVLDIKTSDSAAIATLENSSSSASRPVTFRVVNYAGTFGASSRTSLRLTQSRGSRASPDPVQSGDLLGAVDFSGQNVSGFPDMSNTGASVFAQATETFSGSAAGSSLTFATAPNGSTTRQNRMFIDQNGNVGIGTTAPAATLHVAPTAAGASEVARFEKANAAGSAGVNIYQNGVQKGSLGTGDFVASGGQNADFGATSFGNFIIAAGGTTERMRIASSGNVGFGITNPVTRVDVNGAARVSSGLQFSDGSTSYRAMFTSIAQDTIRALPQSFGGGVNLSLEGVHGSVRSSAPLMLSFNMSSGPNSTPSTFARWQASSQANTVTFMQSDLVPTDGAIAVNPLLRVMEFNGNSGNILMAHDGTSARGMVGIGTSSPTQRLDVNGAIRSSSGGFIFPDGTIATTAITSATSGGTSTTDVTFSADTDLNGTGDVSFGVAGSERLRINNLGNIGIGTGTPDSRLNVIGSTNDSTANGLNISSQSGISRFLVRNDGRVGIGVTSPTQALDILGSARVSGAYTGALGNSGVPTYGFNGVSGHGMFLDASNNLSFSTASNRRMYLDGSGSFVWNENGSSAQTFRLRPSNAQTSDVLLIQQNPNQGTATLFSVNGSGGGFFQGNVGIGTTAPATKLEVRDSADVTVGVVRSSSGAINLTRTDTESQIISASGSGAARRNMLFGTSDGVTMTPRMYISGADGNVGVGTTAPAQKLEVNGGVRLNTTDAKPVCSATTRGTFWMTQGGAGVKDSVEVCAKDAADAYAWRTLY